MLTRLRVSGFKNLVDVDLRFGPFTCVAGVNGVGKSNLFDAIRWLSLLADRPLLEAAQGVRGGRSAGVEHLFHRAGGRAGGEVSFEAEMIVRRGVRDDLGQEAEATITFLYYALTLALRRGGGASGPLEIVREELRHIPKGEAHKHLLFSHSASRWRRSAVVGARWAPYFISTVEDGGERLVQLHQDGGSRGQPLKYAASRLPRTVLSRAYAAESPTALAARREMQGWRLLQLEPSALRRPDRLTSPAELGRDGSHLAALLHRLSRERPAAPGEAGALGALACRLAGVVDGVHALRVDVDRGRELVTLRLVDRDGTEHPAPALSDGTLRYLALAALELDPRSPGLLCLEEPENGVHPERVPAMLTLLERYAVDVEEPLGPENPLRQVIVNTHSPAVVAQVPGEDLLVATTGETGARFHPLPETWRDAASPDQDPVPFGKLLAYLNPVAPWDVSLQRPPRRRRRVIDRKDVQQLPLLPPS